MPSDAVMKVWREAFRQLVLNGANVTKCPAKAEDAAEAVIDRAIAEAVEQERARAETLAEALRPFARIEPSGFFAEDGSEAEAYIAVLAGPADGEFTGEDLATARAALKAWDSDQPPPAA